jgi:hypothetical protein
MDLEQVSGMTGGVVGSREVPGVTRTRAREALIVRGASVRAQCLERRYPDGRKSELCEAEDAYWYL